MDLFQSGSNRPRHTAVERSLKAKELLTLFRAKRCCSLAVRHGIGYGVSIEEAVLGVKKMLEKDHKLLCRLEPLSVLASAIEG